MGQGDNLFGFIGRLQAVYFGWWIVGSTILLQILVAGLFSQAFGTYVAVWQGEFGWSKTTFATAFALQRGLVIVLSPVQGWLLERFSSRFVVRSGLLITAIGFVLLSQVTTVIGLFTVLLIVAVGVAFTGTLSLATVVINWFDRQRSSALSIMQTGVSIGGLGVPLVALALTSIGWQETVIASAAILLLVGLPATKLIRNRPEDYGLLPDGAAANYKREPNSRPPTNKAYDYSVSEAIKTRKFWLVALGHSTGVMTVTAVTVHIVVHLSEGVGLSLQNAASVVAILTASAMLGQICGGVLGDRFDKRHISFAAMLGHSVALVAVAYGRSFTWIVVFALLHGFAWGVRGPLMQALRADYFGRKHFPKIMGLSLSIAMIGQIVGPLLVGVLADATDNYSLGFSILAAIVGASSLCFLALPAPFRAASTSDSPM